MMSYLSWDYLQHLLTNNIGLVLLLFTLVFLYNYYTSTHNYFRERGIPFLKPTILLGNIGSRVFLKISFHDFNLQIYKHFNGIPYAGYFEGRRPLLMLRDPELIKTVMIKDFDHFTDRNTLATRSSIYIQKMMINLKGKEWKNVRSVLTPTFSSGKLRAMENLVQQCGQQMVEFLNKRPAGDTDLEMKEFIGRYTLEVIGSCAFGLDCSSLKDPDAEFVKIAGRFMEVPLLQRYMFFLILLLYPAALKYLPVSMMNSEVISHLKDVVTSSKIEREQLTNPRRNDFMQLMVDAAQKENDVDPKERIMKEEVIQAQAILFLFAGFETSSTLLSFACGEIAANPELQEKLRSEIIKAAAENGGECTYDAANGIPILEQVLLETLRMYPPVSRVDRVCTKPYTLPEANWNVNVGDVVVIPVAGIMHDPEYYPEPHVFDPERFSAEEKARRPQHLFLSFGLGPRNCIGLRFAMMSAKFALFYLLKDFKLSKCSKTQSPVKFDKRAFLLKAERGVWVKAEPIVAKNK